MELTVQNACHNSQNHQNMVSYTLNNINKIIANLEKSNRRKDDEGDPTLIQEHVSTLMTKFSDDSYDLSRDLSSIVDTFKGDRFDSQQLEHIVEHEQQRSRHILQLASFLDNQVNKLFIVMEGMFGHLDKGRKLPLGIKESVSSKLSVVQETIDSMTKVMCSEPHELQNVMDKAEKDIATATEEAKTLDVILPPHDQEVVPPPEVPAPVIVNLGPTEPSLDNIDGSSVDEEEEDENTGPSMWERLSAIRRNSGSKSNIPAIEEKPIMMDAECQTEVPETDDVVLESSTEEAVEVEMELDEPWGTYDSSRNDSPRTSSRPGNNNGGSRNGMRSPSSRNGRTASADGRNNNNEGGDLSGTTDLNEQNGDTASAGIGSGNTDPCASARNSNDLSRPTSEQKKQQQLLDQQQNSSINNADNNTKQKLYGSLNDDAFREGMKQIIQQKTSTASQKQQMNANVNDFVSKALVTEAAALKSKTNTKDGSDKQAKPAKGAKQPAVTSADSKDSTSKTKATAGTTKKTTKKSSSASGSKSTTATTTAAKVAKKKDRKTADANSSSAKVATDGGDVEENEEEEDDEGDEENRTDSIKNEESKRRLSLVQVVTEVISTTARQQQQVEREKEEVGAAKGLGVLHPVDASESKCEEEEDMLEAMTGNSQLGNYQLDLQDVEEEIVAGGGGGGARYCRNRRNSNSVLLVSHKSGKIELDLIVGEDEGIDTIMANPNDGVEGIAATNADLDESVVSSVDLDSFQSDDQISVESEEPPDSDSDDVLLMSADSYLSGKLNHSSKKNEEDKKISEDPFYSPLTDGMMNVKSYPIVHHPSPETLRRMSQTKSRSHLKTALDGSRSRHGSVVRKTSSAGSHNRHHYSMQVEMATKGTSTEDLLVYDTGSSLFRPMVENRMKIGGGGESSSAVTNAPSFLAPIDDKFVSRSLDSRLLLQPRRRASVGSNNINNVQSLSSSSSSSAQNSFKSSKLLKRGSNIIKSSQNDEEDEINNDNDGSFDTNNNSKSPSSKKNKNNNKTSQQLFDEQLKASVNPLLEIYNKYHASLPESWKAQLLTASNTAADNCSNNIMMTIPSIAFSVNTLSEQLQKMNNDSACASIVSTDDTEAAATAAAIAMNEIKLLNIKKQFASSIHVLENLKLTTTNNLIRLGKCERLTSELLNLMNDGATDANVYQEKLETLFRKLGVLVASKMFVEIQLAHYRGMFTEIQAISESAFPTMMRDVEELRTSYKLFISTQGKIVRLGRRVKALKTYCATVQLLSPHTNAAMKLESRAATGGINRTETDYYIFDEIQRLEAELETSRHRNNQLSEELYHMTHRADNSPGALSFYATLTDPSLIPSLKALTEDLLVLKDFANMSDHIDFATLRISLKKCVSATPYVERFIQKYNSLYKRWTKRRLEMYYIRNREGIVSDSSEGIEDGSDSCPICCNDRRSAGGSNDVEFQKEMKKNMLLQKIMNVTRSSTASSPIKGSTSSSSPVHINNNNNNNINNHNSSMGIADNSSTVHQLSQTSISPQQLSLSQSLPALTVLPPLSHRQHPQRL